MLVIFDALVILSSALNKGSPSPGRGGGGVRGGVWLAVTKVTSWDGCPTPRSHLASVEDFPLWDVSMLATRFLDPLPSKRMIKSQHKGGIIIVCWHSCLVVFGWFCSLFVGLLLPYQEIGKLRITFWAHSFSIMGSPPCKDG